MSRIQGAGMAMQNALPRPLKTGDTILAGDVLSTGKDARLEVTMIDGTVLTLGEKAVMVVSEFVMGNQPNAAARLLQGAFNATTGKIMQTADATFLVETEVATIGVRGTTFWGGMLDDKFEVAMLVGKGVYLETPAGWVELSKPGEGTAIADAKSQPTAPTAWGKAKIDRAVATVSFR
ncbi:MAG: FecR family protein [Rhodospirillaceae bacterium]